MEGGHGKGEKIDTKTHHPPPFNLMKGQLFPNLYGTTGQRKDLVNLRDVCFKALPPPLSAEN